MLDLRRDRTVGGETRASPGVLVGTALVVGSVVAAVIGWIVVRPPSLGYDMLILRSAAERLVSGLPLYLDPTAERFVPGSVELYYGPPAFAVASLPLTLFDEATVRLIAMPLSLGLVLAALALLVRTVPGRVSPNGVLTLITGTLLSFAVLWGSTLGAASIVVLFLAAVAWAGLERRTTWGSLIAALALGTAIAFRLYPAVLLVPLVLGGRWRTAIASLAVVVGWTVIGILVVGLTQTLDYLDVARALAALGAPMGSISPAALASTAGWSPLAVQVVRLGSLALGVLLLVVGGLLLGGSRAGRVRHGLDPSEFESAELVGWGLALAGMLLVTPVLWDHYLTALLPLSVGLTALTRRAIFGLVPVAFLPGSLGGIALVAVPILGLVAVGRRLRG